MNVHEIKTKCKQNIQEITLQIRVTTIRIENHDFDRGFYKMVILLSTNRNEMIERRGQRVYGGGESSEPPGLRQPLLATTPE